MHSDSVAFDVSVHTTTNTTTNGPPHAPAVGEPSVVLANRFPNNAVTDIVTDGSSNSGSNCTDERAVGIANRLRARSRVL